MRIEVETRTVDGEVTSLGRDRRDTQLAPAGDARAPGRSESGLNAGTAAVMSGVALLRGLFGYGDVQDMVGAVQSAAELESRRTLPRTLLAYLGLGLSLHYGTDVSALRELRPELLRLQEISD